MIVLVYTLTLFVSATLLFVVQPMFARMILPLLGGSPAVWNTAMVFYQTALLVGYGYAHLLARRVPLRRQLLLHMAVLFVPLLVLPFGVPSGWRPPTSAQPISWTLLLLTIGVGLPFVVVATSSPLLQAWFAGTRHPAARDPYFLYAASNGGSMLALLSYPLLIEPSLRLAQQRWVWALGYVVLIGLIGACGVLRWRYGTAADLQQTPMAPGAPLRWRQRGRWVVVAAVPSSLMLSVTTYLSTELAPIPLLWIIPLALYLLTFMLVFARRPLVSHALMQRLLPLTVVPLMLVLIVRGTDPLWLLISIHLVAFFVVTMVCHGELARSRPAPRHLTEFYVWLSVGGALGGAFNALLAPLIFNSVVEYPLVLVLACLVSRADVYRDRLSDLTLPLILAGATVGAVLVAEQLALPQQAQIALAFGLPAFVAYTFSRRPLRFGLAVGLLLLIGATQSFGGLQPLHTQRSFFGIHRILYDEKGGFNLLMHGNIVHGRQHTDPALRRQPLQYYYPSGPIGQVFAAYNPQHPQARIAVVGLGSGALACYRTPQQQWTFYEIDPFVEQIARTPAYFTYLRDCADDAPVVVGDARLSLIDTPDGTYDLLILDAYSSDTIPVHLLTREALALYRAKTSPDGIIAFHISNKYLDLWPVVAALARDANMTALVQHDLSLTAAEKAAGKAASEWTVLAGNDHLLAAWRDDPRWQGLDSAPHTRVWTDDYSSVISVLR